MKPATIIAATLVMIAATPALAHLPTRPTFSAPCDAAVKFGFGPRHSAGAGRAVAHRGIDYAAPHGAPVHAAADGRVIYAGWNGAYGKVVILEHAGGYTSLYAHLAGDDVVTGQRVRRGEKIARVGATGRRSGAALHWEVRRDGAPIDPASVLVR